MPPSTGLSRLACSTDEPRAQGDDLLCPNLEMKMIEVIVTGAAIVFLSPLVVGLLSSVFLIGNMIANPKKYASWHR